MSSDSDDTLDVERFAETLAAHGEAGRKITVIRGQLLADGVDPALVRTLGIEAARRFLIGQSKSGWTALVLGIGAASVGVGISAATFAAAGDGGTYVALWGLVLFGILSTWRGFRGVLRRLQVAGDAMRLLTLEGGSVPTGTGRRLGAERALLAASVLVLVGVLGAGGVLVAHYDSGDADENRVQTGNRNASGAAASSAANAEGNHDVFELKVGDCFRDPSRGEVASVQVVSCTSALADGEVIDGFTTPDRSSYPGEDYFDETASERCPAAADSFFYPTAESWKAGDWGVLCLRLD